MSRLILFQGTWEQEPVKSSKCLIQIICVIFTVCGNAVWKNCQGYVNYNISDINGKIIHEHRLMHAESNILTLKAPRKKCI